METMINGKEVFNKSALKNKTPRELVDIIERKDRIERELRKDMIGTCNELEKSRKEAKVYKEQRDSNRETIEILDEQISEAEIAYGHLKEELEVAENMRKSLQNDYDMLLNDYQDTCDSNRTLYEDGKRKLNNKDKIIAILFVVIIVLSFLLLF